MSIENNNYCITRFIASVADICHLPQDKGIEVAFVGYSNSGKSSALNAFTNQKSLARTSKKPGRTQMINFFEVKKDCRLVDLPGYGYAAVAKEMQYQWQRTLAQYLQMRNCLKGLVLLMDIRHPLKDLDQHIIEWSVNVGIPVIGLLTKADKLAFGARIVQLNIVRGAVLSFMGDIQIEAFSAPKKIGVDKLSQKINSWFNKSYHNVL